MAQKGSPLRRAAGLGAAVDQALASLGALPLPTGFAEVLAHALALDAAGPRAATAQLLRGHYLQAMPGLRAAQLDPRAEPAGPLFHTALRLDELPRLRHGLHSLFALVRAADGDVRAALGADSPEALWGEPGTVAQLYQRSYYGGFMPLLYAYPGDLARMGRALAQGEPVARVVDRCLAAPLVHELSHGPRPRAALFPPYLDECVAAYIGALALPELAFPRRMDGAAEPLPLAPWLVQVGQALGRRFGVAPLVRAQLGLLPWEDVLPKALLDAAARLGWDEYVTHRHPHFLTSALLPEPWLKLVWLGAAGAELSTISLAELAATPWSEIPVGDTCEVDPDTDAADADIAITEWALRAACACTRRDGDTLRAEAAVPAGPLTADLRACVLTAPASGGEGPASRYLFPPAVAARLRAAGWHGYSVTLHDPEAAPAAARALHRGITAEAGAGFELRAWTVD